MAQQSKNRSACSACTQVVALVEILSQLKKIEQDIRSRGTVRWKHAIHLLRLLLTGAATLRTGSVPVRVEAHRDRLLAVKHGEVPWPTVDAWIPRAVFVAKRSEISRGFLARGRIFST